MTAPRLAVVLVVAVLASMLSTTVAHAVPASPTGLSPDHPLSEVNANPTLTWNRVSGATSYDVEVSSTSAFTSTIYKANTVNRRVVPTVQLPASDVFWRVRTRTDSGTSAWAETSFRRGTGAAPQLVSPADGTELTQPDEPPLLTWQPVQGATAYTVEIDGAEHDWVDTKTYTTKTSSLVVPDPQETGTYWWRVKATLGSGLDTVPSEERSFEVGALPVVGPADQGVADLTTKPLEGATVQDVVFDWAPVKGAVSYDVRVATDNSFNDVIDHPIVYGTRYSPKTTYDVDDYWWQVRARNIFGKAQEWTDVRIRSFRRDWTDRPSLTYPADTTSTAVGNDLYFQWTPVHLASRYRFDLGTDRNFSPGTFDSCLVTQTTYTPGYKSSPVDDGCMPTPGGTYFWRVKALDGPHGPDVQGVYSPIRTFVYDPGQVRPLAPANGATVAIPTLSWEPADRAEKYLVTMRYGSTTVTATTYSTSWTYTGTKPLDPTKGPFSWSVQGVDYNGVKTTQSLGAWRSFNLGGTDTTPAVADLTPLTPSPSDSSTRFPQLTWKPQAGAAYYRVYAGTAGSGFFKALGGNSATPFPYAAATDLGQDFFDAGRYDWFVKAFDSNGAEIGTGPTSTFAIADLATVTGQQVALSGTALDTSGVPCTRKLADATAICTDLTATPVLDWRPVPSASHYVVYLSRNRFFQNMVYGSLSDSTRLPMTNNTRWTPTEALPDSQAGVAYYWFVRPCKTRIHCSPDPTEATHAFSKKSNTVAAYNPVSASAATTPAPTRYDAAAPVPEVANDVQFSWDDYLDSNQAGTATEHSDQAARGYHLQVGTTPAFSTILDDVTVDQTTYTAYDRTYPEGDLYWRIQAVDGTGNAVSWSDPMKFRKTSPTVDPASLSPDDERVTPTQPFVWKPLDFASSYDIEVYRNADTNASSTNRVLSTNVKQVSYTSPNPLLASPTAYVWRVRRVDASSRRGAWSDWGGFKVGGTAPGLVAPASGGLVNGSDALFGWQTTQQATSFLFERRAVGSTSSSESVTTVANAWAPTRPIPDGAWEWRISSLDAAGKVIATSAWRPFTVDGSRPTVVSKSPTTTIYRTKNFTVKFSEPVTGVSTSTMKVIRKGYSTPIKAAVTLSADRKTATLNPASNLRVGKYYRCYVTTGIHDLAGNALVSTSWRVRAR